MPVVNQVVIDGSARGQNAGSILLLVLVFLVLLTLLAVNLLSTASLQLQLSTNFREREARLVSATAIADVVGSDVSLFDLDLAPGSALCLAGDSAAVCSGQPLAAIEAVESLPPYTDLSLRVLRDSPEVVQASEIRERESNASSAVGERFGVFVVEAAVSGVQRGSGSAEVVKGVGVRLPFGTAGEHRAL